MEKDNRPGGIAMFLWKNDRTEPYQNMAEEEYLLMTAEEPAVMLWRNTPAVIIGKNQDARAEVDFSFTNAHGIKVVRRLTGGGAVFHDLGNVNYTFVVPDGTALDFSAFTRPITEALAGLGITAERSGRNDLVISADGRKFSGTAQCIYHRKKTDGSLQKVLMHHGTLLFSADLSSLSGALTPDKEKIASKGIRSVKSRVVNLSSLLPEEHRGMNAETFKAYLEEYFIRSGAVPREFSPADKAAIKRLAAEKYETDAWLFGKFCAGERTSRRRFGFGSVCVSLCFKGEKIGHLAFSGDFFGTKDIAELEKAISGVSLDYAALTKRLSEAGLSDYIMGAAPAEIAGLILEAVNPPQ